MSNPIITLAGIVAAIGLCATAAAAETVTITFDGGCEALEAGSVGERQSNGREGPIAFTDPNLASYGHCSDDILLGDDGYSGSSSLRSVTGDTFRVLSLDIAGGHRVVRILDSQDLDRSDAVFALQEGAAVERVEDFALLDIVGQRPDGSTVRTQWAPDDPGATTFAGFRGINNMSFSLTTDWDGLGSLRRDEDGFWIGCNGLAFSCGSAAFDNLVIELRPVPVPAAGVMMAGLLAGLGAARGMRRRSVVRGIEAA